MQFNPPLIPARLLRRYKRFLADVEFPDGTHATVHTPNTGSMRGCAEPGMRIWLRDATAGQEGSGRKYRYSWDVSETAGGVLVGVNTLLANRLVEEAIDAGVITELGGYRQRRREVPCGDPDARPRSRIDLLLEDEAGRCFVEVKNVTAMAPDGCAIFPDAATARGRRHLHELAAQAAQGHRAVMLFCVPRSDAAGFAPAWDIDPAYAETLHAVAQQGVEIYAYKGETTPRGSQLTAPLPVDLAAPAARQ